MPQLSGLVMVLFYRRFIALTDYAMKCRPVGALAVCFDSH